MCDRVPRLPVATGFPAGQTPLETRLQEVRVAVADGATEIDIVINRMLALTGQWEGTLRPTARSSPPSPFILASEVFFPLLF